MFVVGDKIRSKKYGVGVIRKIDNSDFDFTYLARFYDKGRTLVWLPKNERIKMEKQDD